MKKFKLVLFITIFTLFIGINSVSAADKIEIGNCSYSNDKVVRVYSNGEVEANFAGLNPTIADTYKNGMFKDGKCYNYMYMVRSGRNSLTFTNTRNTSISDEEYYLFTKSEVNCYYDMKITDSEYSRLYFNVLENGSRMFLSALSGKNQYSKLDLNYTNTIKTYNAKVENNFTITYDTSKSSSRTLIFGTMYDTNTISGFYESLKGGKCPTVYYKVMDDGQISITSAPPDNDAGKGYVAADSNKKYNTTDGTGVISENTDDNASDSMNDVNCFKRGEIPVISGWDGKTPIYSGKSYYNFRLKRENGKIQFCVAGDTGDSCTSYGYTYSLAVKNTKISEEMIYFALDTDLKEYIESQTAGFTCPSYIGVYYLNNGSPATSRYIFTTDSSKVTWNTEDGRWVNPGTSQLDPTDSGETDYDCDELIGPNVLNFLTVIFRLIRIVGPIIALLLGMYDLFMAMVNGEDDAKKKAMKKLKGRIIAAVLLLLLPYILDILLNLINKAGTNCIPH